MLSMRVLMVISILLSLIFSLVPGTGKHYLIETEEGGQAIMKSDNRAILNQWKPSKFYRENLENRATRINYKWPLRNPFYKNINNCLAHHCIQGWDTN